MTFEFSSDGPISCNTAIEFGCQKETDQEIETDEEFLRKCGILSLATAERQEP